MKLLTFLILVYLFFSGVSLKSQSFNNVKIVKGKNNLILIYDFNGTLGALYSVNVFYTNKEKQNFQVVNCTGAIGEDIEPGRKKVLYINDTSIMDHYSETAKFRFDAALTTPPLRVTNNLVDKKIKRGKTARIEWMGGKDIDFIHVALFKGRKEISRIEVPNNLYSYDFKIPKKTKGKDYELKLIRPNGKTVRTGTGKFIVKPRSRGWVLLLAGLGGGLGAMLNMEDSPMSNL